MSALTNALTVVLAINLMLFLGQISVNNLAEEAGLTNQTIYNPQGSPLNRFYSEGYVLNETSNFLPEGQTGGTSVSPEERTGFFTDIFSTMTKWIQDKLGINYIIGVLRAPYNFLTALHLPKEFVWGIGSLWYGLTLFLIISWLLGRDT